MILRILLLVITIFCTAVSAENYPIKPIRIIVPYSSGGPTDAVARIFSERLSERLGQPVIIQTISGGGGLVGTEAAARANPDGYTLYFGANSMAIYPFIKTEGTVINFNSLDFVPIGGIANSAHVLLASKQSGITDISTLIERARTSREAVSYGSAGAGGSTHLPLAFFEKDIDVKLLHVPYKGAAPAFIDLLAGRIDLATPGYSAALYDPITTGKVTAIAVTSAKRLPFLPQIPTWRELGYSDMVFPIWLALFAPPGTSDAIVAKISKEVEEISLEPEYVKRLAAQGNIAEWIPPAELKRVLYAQYQELDRRFKTADLHF